MRTTAYAPRFVMSVLLASVAIGQCSGNIAILGGAAVMPSNLLPPAGLPLLIDPLTGTNGDFSQPASWKVGKPWADPSILSALFITTPLRRDWIFITRSKIVVRRQQPTSTH